MSTNDPTADDLTASLLTALAAAGHPARVEGGALTLVADGMRVPVQIEPRFDPRFSGTPRPAKIVFDRFGAYTRRFAPLSGVFDWPRVAAAAVEIAAAIKCDREHADVAHSEAERVAAQATALNAALGLGWSAPLRAAERDGRLALVCGGGALPAGEAQVRAMVGAARACGLLGAPQKKD